MSERKNNQNQEQLDIEASEALHSEETPKKRPSSQFPIIAIITLLLGISGVMLYVNSNNETPPSSVNSGDKKKENNTPPPTTQRNRMSVMSDWWSKRTQNERYAIGFGCTALGILATRGVRKIWKARIAEEERAAKIAIKQPKRIKTRKTIQHRLNVISPAEAKRIAAEAAELERIAAERAAQIAIKQPKPIKTRKTIHHRLNVISPAEAERIAAERAAQIAIKQPKPIKKRKTIQHRLNVISPAEAKRIAAEAAELERMAESSKRREAKDNITRFEKSQEPKKLQDSESKRTPSIKFRGCRNP